MCLAIVHQCHASGQMDSGNVCCMNCGRGHDVGRTLAHSFPGPISDMWLAHDAHPPCMTAPCMTACNTLPKHGTWCIHGFTSHSQEMDTALNGEFCHFWFTIGLHNVGSSDYFSVLWLHRRFACITQRGSVSNMLYFRLLPQGWMGR